MKELIKQLKEKILKKFLMILGVTSFVCFLVIISFLFINNNETKMITFATKSPDSKIKIIKEEEIRFYERRYDSIMTSKPNKELLSLVKQKFLREYLKFKEKIGVSAKVYFKIEEEYYVPFLEKTKIYRIDLRMDLVPGWLPRKSFIIGVKDNKIFDFKNLYKFNELIREKKIWIDTPTKALKYAVLYISLIGEDEDIECDIVNSLGMFIDLFVLRLGRNPDEIGKKVVYCKTLEEYRQYRPKQYQQLLKYEDEIKSPHVIKETKDNYEIIIYAREILKNAKYELALIKLKLIIYKNGEIDLKKEYLVREIRKWTVGPE